MKSAKWTTYLDRLSLTITIWVALGLLVLNVVEVSVLYYLNHNQLAVIFAGLPILIMALTLVKPILKQTLSGPRVDLGGFELDDFSLFDAAFVLVAMVLFFFDITSIEWFWLVLTITVVVTGRLWERQASLKQMLQLFWWLLILNLPVMVVYANVGTFKGF
ncbi:hypothetical protein [Lactiplantibacillus daowaiensis]|uniref:Integral membrane protein n=1 Tax=Lactiplantibacillus daowaiensis TaxID=2559918 RepID=A0ABW1S2R8_9LACO|nr:hypothetical protein [Lactiplantibacillus daowaiensis]